MAASLLLGSTLYAFIDSSDQQLSFMLAALLCSFVVLTALVSAYRSTRDILNPMSLGMLYFAMLFPMHGLVMVDDTLVVSFHGAERHTWFGVALLVAAWSAFVMHLGFRSRLAARIAALLPKLPFHVTDTGLRRGTLLWVIVALALGARVLLAASGLAFHFQHRADDVDDFMGFQFLLTTLSGLSALATLMFIGRGIREQRPSLMAVGGALLLVDVAWGLYSGSRLTTVLPIIYVLILLHRVWRPIRLRHLVIGLALFIFVVFPFLTAYRSNYNERMDEIARDGARGEFVAETVTGLFSEDDDGFSNEQDSAVETLAARTHGLTSLSLIMRHTPDRHPFLLGVPYLSIPLQILVPRAVWSDKPTIAAFADTFRTRYWGLRPGDQTSVAVSQLGDLWVNLHLFGALFGSFLMGTLFRFLADHLRLGSEPGGLFHHVIYTLMLFPAVIGLSALGDAFIAGNVKTLFVLGLIAWGLRARTDLTLGRAQ